MYLKLMFVIVFFCAMAGYMAYKKFDDAVRQTALPGTVDLIVCMAYSDDRADRAVALLNQGYGQKIVATTKQTHDALLDRRVRRELLVLLAPDAKTTYQEGVLLRKYLQNSRPARVLVVSDGVHLFRVHWTLDHLFRKNSHSFWFLASDRFHTSYSSWKERLQLKSVGYELAAVVYYWFGHGLFGIEENPPWIDTAKKIRLFQTAG